MNELPEFNGWQGVRALGAGRCGETYEIVRDDGFGTAEHGALKIVSIASSDDAQETAQLRQQLESMSRVLRASAALSENKNLLVWRDHAIRRYADGSGWEISLRTDLAVPLERYIRTHTYGESDVAKIGAGICNALALCRDRGIVHGDVKPQNIFVSGGNFEGSLDVRLGDFGMAALVPDAAGDFAAPEVLCGEEPSAENDLYSLGMVLYWMLNDRRVPFAPLPPEGVSGSDLAIARDMRLRGDPMPKPLHGSKALQAVVMKAIADQPADRYQSAEELRDALLAAVRRPGTAQTAPGTAAAAAAAPVAASAAAKAERKAEQAKAAKAAEKRRKSAPAEDDYDEDDDEPKGKGLRRAVWIVGAVALLALLALLGSVLFGGGGKKEEKKTYEITLSMDKAEIAPDEEINLIAEVKVEDESGTTRLLADPKIEWSSSRESVAEVSSKGVVKGLKEGDARITAKFVTDEEKKTDVEAHCDVTVTKDAIKITKIELGRDDAELKIGDKLTLDVKVEPKDADLKNISWTSDNSNVASVKDGVVTAHQAGKATITAASGDKSNKVEAKCVITVKPKAEIRTVNCPTGNVTLTNVGSAATVTFTVTGTELGSVANTAKVYATDTSVVQLGTLQRSAGANSDTYTVTITALKEGVSTIAFEISDPDGTAHSATCGVNITVPTPEPTPAPTPTPVPTPEPTAPPETDAPNEGGN